MRYADYTVRRDGFCGHLAEPEERGDRAVIVVMGGEQSLLPGRKIAEAFAHHGIAGLAVSLFGAEGLPAGPDRVPLELFEPAAALLDRLGYASKAIYGMSMGSVFALTAACRYRCFDKVVLVSPTHVPFEGSVDKKRMSGHSVVTAGGRDMPFVPLELGRYKASRYYTDPETGRRVMGMWLSYRDAYRLPESMSACLRPEETGAELLLVCGDRDEAWPSSYSVEVLHERMAAAGKQARKLVCPGAGHLLGVMPLREKNAWLYRAIPLIGLMYRSFRDDRSACLAALEMSQREILAFLR